MYEIELYGTIPVIAKEKRMSDKKMGRPTKYDPKYDELVVELGAQGMSKEQIARDFGVAWNTLDCWAEKHEDFKMALRTAKSLELAYWEDLGIRNVLETPGGQRLNGAVYNKIMAARFPAKYSERNKVELSGGENPIQVQSTHTLGQEILSEVLASIQASR